jgi:hypothetical protein
MSFHSGELFPSAARTADPTPAVFYLDAAVSAVDIDIDTTAASAPSTTFNIDYQLPSGAWRSALVSAAITGVGVVTLRVGASVAVTANLSAQLTLPAALRVRPVHGNANSHTYAVQYRTR